MPPTAKTVTPAKPGRAANANGYRQVADALRDQITAGALPPAAPLPSEAQLVATYGVSRPTARAAVASLVSEGLVITLHGKGSFVRRGDDRPSVTHPRGITSTTSGRGTRQTVTFQDTDADDAKWTEVEAAGTYRTDATADLALALGLPERAPVFVADRLLADRAGRRMFHRSHVPFAVAVDVPALEADPFRAPGDLYGALTRAGHELAWTETVRARMPSPDDAAALRIPGGTPMLITRRTTRDTTGRILAMEETRVSAEDTQLTYGIAAHLAE
jgi:GntR family transcriptional regulator